MNESMYGQVGEKRNMSALEKKVDALLQFCTAETEEERGKYHLSLRQLMTVREPTGFGSQELHDQIDKVLLDLGVPDHLLGYGYLHTAIAMALEDPELVRQTTYVLYPAVAKCHGTHPNRIERDIRHAIECGWMRCDLQMQEKYFGGKVDPRRCKPKNSEFIARVANVIRWQGMVS